MKTQNLLFLPFIVTASLCSSCGSNGFSLSNDDDSYSFNMDDCPDETEVLVSGLMNDKYPSQPTAYKKMTVKKAEDISNIVCWESKYSHYYLLGVYTDSSLTHLVRASQLKCYNGTYDNLYLNWGLKSEQKDYFKRYIGTYHNHRGDELIVKKDEVNWTYTFNKDYKVQFKCKGIVSNDYFSPLSNRFYINNKEIKAEDGIQIEFSISNLFFTSSEDGSYSAFKTSINPAQSVLNYYLNKYLEGINSKYRYDTTVVSVAADSCYSIDNNITIKYDL